MQRKHANLESWWLRVGDDLACGTQRGLGFGAWHGDQVLHALRVLVVLGEQLLQRPTDLVELVNWRRIQQRAFRHRTRGILAQLVRTRQTHDAI